MNSNSNNITAVTSSSSNDSLALESKTTKPLFNDDLLVIERSNRELELRLSASKQQQLFQQQQHQEQLYQQEQQEQLYEQHKQLYNQQQEQQYQLHKQQQTWNVMNH